MFFGKTANKVSVTPQDIAVLGTGALALYLADAFQNLGHRVCLLCPPQNADEYNATDFVFKDSARLKNPRGTFRFSHELPFRPQVLLLASSVEHQRADLTLLSPPALTDTTIISFCFPEHGAILPEILKKPVISAFFDGWLTRAKNHIHIYGHSPKVTFSLNDASGEAAALTELFEPAGIAAVFLEDAKTNLWNYIGPRLAYDLLTAVFEQNVFQLTKTADGRKAVDTLLAEISSLAAADNAVLPETALLTKLYEIPSAWTSPLQQSVRAAETQYFERLNAFVSRQSGSNDKRYPFLHELFHRLYNKY